MFAEKSPITVTLFAQSDRVYQRIIFHQITRCAGVKKKLRDNEIKIHQNIIHLNALMRKGKIFRTAYELIGVGGVKWRVREERVTFSQII